eukprot:266248-Prymnesium_polylepis.1
MRPNGGLTGPCVRGSQATLARATVSVATRRSRIFVGRWRRPADRRADAARRDEARARPARRDET